MGWLVWLRQPRPRSLSPTPSAHPPHAAKCKAVAAPEGSPLTSNASRSGQPGSWRPLPPQALRFILRLSDVLCIPGPEPLCWLPRGPENAPLQTPHGFCSAVPSQGAPAPAPSGTFLVLALPLPDVLLSV